MVVPAHYEWPTGQSRSDQNIHFHPYRIVVKLGNMNPSTTQSYFNAGDRIEVLLPRPFDHGFDYIVPQGMQLQAGDYVSVPFGRTPMQGVVWGAGLGEVDIKKCKAVAEHHHHLLPLSDPMREWIDWTANYNLAEKGAVLKMVMPMAKAITEPSSEVVYRINDKAAGKMTAAREAVLKTLETGAKTKSELGDVSAAVLSGMVKAGMIEKQTRMMEHYAQRFHPAPAPNLSDEQQHASEQLRATLHNGFSTTLLDGVTGSGKTEVYFDTIETLLTQDQGQIVVLLPEIVLTHQWMSRFKKRFGGDAILWHSSVSLGQRKKHWQMIASGSARVVVGARSALYLPYADLQLIIVDEEHEPAYKQEDHVLYHARDMAVARAAKEQIPVLLASATPSLETVYNVKEGKYKELTLTERHGAFDFPEATLIDLRQDKPERGAWLSPTLVHAIGKTVGGGHQAMLFLNRRGYAPLLLCRSCGHRFECPNCDAWMVQHQSPARLQCHHCDYRTPLPSQCPECSKDELAACGPGVERVLEEVEATFPDARVVVLTSDEKGIADKVAEIADKQVDIIIGTQLVAKGHHFPHLALVGVVDADLGLKGGDLRASERTYQLLHQLAGRAGRQEVEGRVYLQTVEPEHAALQAMAKGDRDAFVALELAHRERAAWPPYGRLAALLIDGPNESQVVQIARQLVQSAPKSDGILLLGPAPAPLSRLRNQYRYRILIKAPKSLALSSVLKHWQQTLNVPRSVRLKIDIDPYHFL